MRNNKWYLYKHTSPSNGVYIGITKQNPLVRWNNGLGYRRHPYFYNAIKKYGWENFTHEILLTGLTQEEAEEFEKQYIAKYKNGGKCYNILDGGLTTADTSKKVYQYDLNGQFIKEWHSTVEVAAFYDTVPSAIANCCNPKYRTKTACGYIFSYEKSINKEEIIKPSLKPVNQYDLQLNLIKTWPTRKEAQQAYPNWRIGACLNGKKKTCNGYIFKYADDNNLEVPIHKGREIIIDGVKYKSIKHASEILNISQYKLRKKLC